MSYRRSSPAGPTEATGPTGLAGPGSSRSRGPTPEPAQRREHVRLSGNRPVLVYVGSTGRPVHSYAVDLAAGGVLLAGPDVLGIGEEVQFTLTLSPDREPIDGVGTVVRSDLRGRRAISFTRVSDVDRRRVVRYIFERERAEARERRLRGGADGA